MQKIFRSRGREQSANRRISFLERAVEKFQRTKLYILPLNSRSRQISHNFLNLFLRRVDSPVVLSATNLPAGDEIQAIANAAGFHFAAIEQGGTSLYATMALKASSLTVLQIIACIGGAEVNHFAIWHDKAGNAPAVSFGGVTFPDLETFNGDEPRQTNLIMPEPCTFLDSNLPECSVNPARHDSKLRRRRGSDGLYQFKPVYGAVAAVFRYPQCARSSCRCRPATTRRS